MDRVSAGKLAATDMWEPLGIHWHVYKRGDNAAMLNSASVFYDAERRIVTKRMDEMYPGFKRYLHSARVNRLSRHI